MSWFDNARDIWQFLDYYLPTQSPPKDRTDFGPRWPPVNLPVTTRAQGRRGRTIIGIGHSYGGASMHLLNMCIGDIMAGQISIDPIIIAHEAGAYPCTRQQFFGRELYFFPSTDWCVLMLPT